MATSLPPTKVAEILTSFNYDLTDIARLSTLDIQNRFALTQKQSERFVSAFALAKRINSPKAKDKITKSYDIANMFAWLRHEEAEQFHIVMLNRNNLVVATKCISKGGVTGTIADPKLILREALLQNNVCSIILIHNHPSGNTSPSDADKELTQKIKQGARLLDIQVLDHIIIANGTNKTHYSFADEGNL
jgi:DNA repair protein RadC